MAEATKRMTSTPNPARARAEAVFRRVVVTSDAKLDAMAEYKVKQQAEREKMARLKELRLAAKENR
jgi:hypothetical protein